MKKNLQKLAQLLLLTKIQNRDSNQNYWCAKCVQISAQSVQQNFNYDSHQLEKFGFEENSFKIFYSTFKIYRKDKSRNRKLNDSGIKGFIFPYVRKDECMTVPRVYS